MIAWRRVLVRLVRSVCRLQARFPVPRRPAAPPWRAHRLKYCLAFLCCRGRRWLFVLRFRKRGRCGFVLRLPVVFLTHGYVLGLRRGRFLGVGYARALLAGHFV